MNTEWSHLPNARHIDWVLESVKKDTQLWATAQRESMYKVSAAAREAWKNAEFQTARAAARDRAWEVMYPTMYRSIAAQDQAGYAAQDIAWGSALVLVVYDDCDQYLNMGYDKLWIYATLSEKPQALLLLPMVYVREKLNERMVTLT